MEACPHCSRYYRVERLPDHAASCKWQIEDSFIQKNYNEYINLIDSDDEVKSLNERQSQLNDSQETIPCAATPSKYKDGSVIGDVIRQHKATITEDRTQTIIVRRSKILASTEAAIKRSNFTFNCKLAVEFVGEKARDEGGPLREFLRLYTRAITKTSGLLEGHPGHLLFCSSLPALADNRFADFGRMFSYSVALGGPSLDCLDRSAFDYIANRPIGKLDVSQIPDPDVFEQVTKLVAADRTEFGTAIRPFHEWALSSGLHQLGFEQKEHIVESLLKDLLVYRRCAAMEQFITGLRQGGLLEIVRSCPGVSSKLFLYCDTKMTRTAFKALWTYIRADPMSNEHEAEDETLLSWEVLLQSIEENKTRITYGDILVFVTGADSIPPGGFHDDLKIDFYTRTSDRHYPTASTCNMRLYLPRNADAEILQRLMEEVVCNAHIFSAL